MIIRGWIIDERVKKSAIFSGKLVISVAKFPAQNRLRLIPGSTKVQIELGSCVTLKQVTIP